MACVLEAHLKCVGFLWKEKDIVPRKAARLIFDAAMNYLSLLPKESSEYKLVLPLRLATQFSCCGFSGGLVLFCTVR